MAESRAKRMQVVLFLAERKEQELGQQLSQQRQVVEQEIEQLRQLEQYAEQYLQTYSERKSNVRPHELIAYSGFIQRLGDARLEQKAKIERQQKVFVRMQQVWRAAHHKCESIKELIERLKQDENALIDKRLQKELDELVGQQYSRQNLP
ncbi:MAG TPA: flagellar export protein FliJ [Cellvibrio sp.]|nr:flagellar export protein FliJ [Cellvibrio sp.]